LGRTYFDIGGDPDKYFHYLQQAVEVRKIIDGILEQDKSEELKTAERSYNHHYMDSILVKRNGVLEFQRKTLKASEVKEIISEYEELIERKIEDEKNYWSCKSEQFRVRQKILAAKRFYQEKKKECDRAIQEMYKDDVVKTDGSAITLDDVFKYLTAGDKKSDTRQAKYLNDMGRLLSINGEYDYALKFYVASVDIELDKNNISLDLSEAYLGIARIYIAKGKIDVGSAALRKCLRAHEEMGIAKNHEQHEEAIRLESQIVGSKSYISEVEQQMKRRDMFLM
jgi:tetratricopeptide (TPR) repeat protein